MKRYMKLMYIRRVLFATLLVGLVLAGAWFISGFEARAIAEKKEPREVEPKPISVKTVYPRRDKNFQMTVERPADVEAYYRANIEAQVAGQVKWIRVDVGTRVEKDQLLVRVAVPDKVGLLHEKQNVVVQRQRELALMLEKKAAAEIAVKTALANVELKKSLLQEARAQTRYREIQFQNLNELWKRQAAEKIVRDEGERNLDFARASELGADAARIKAEQEVEDARANVKVTEAEVERARQLIDVAKSDEEQIAAIVDYAEVKAPFRGTIVSRHVDPGSFVQNASTGHSTPLLALQRADIVTVVMRVPDNYAQYIHPGTEAAIELDELPGVEIRGKVTRFAPSLITAMNDRTMRVEVDLWNDAPDKYKPFFSDPKNQADLKDGPLPIQPIFTSESKGDSNNRLIPGMYGNMKLILKSFEQIELIPGQSILRSAGRASIYVVENGKAHRAPVQIQMDDGILAHVLLLDKNGKAVGELPEAMQVITSNQEELSEGQAVRPILRQDWGKK